MKTYLKNYLLQGKIFIFIIGILFSSAILFNCKVYASGFNDNIENIEDLILNEAKKYMIEDFNGYKYFDLEKAEKEGASKDTIEVGKIVNGITNNYKNNEIKVNDLAINIFYYKKPMKIGTYGHYCGKGNNGWDKEPIDELDAACQNHDRCYIHGGNNRNCNDRFCSALDYIIRYGSGSKKINYARAAKLIFCF